MCADINVSGNNAKNNTLPMYAPTKIDNNMNNTLPAMATESQMTQLERQGTSISIGETQLIKAISRAIKAMEGPQTAFEVSIHKETHSIMVKVLNKETGELIREVPPEKTLDMVAKMMEIAGILIDERV